jgi:outer membrane lipoprotein-sorting protein
MNRLIVTVLLLGMVIPGITQAQTPEEKGRAIAVQADQHDLGWRDSEAAIRMVLRNRSGQESTRALRLRSLEVTEAGLGDRSVVIFDSPRDIEGTALLSHTKVLEPDNQWLYLPALKRVKRISSKNKSGPFVGSEFAYEDLLSQEVDKYDYRWVRDETCEDLECHVVERIPRYENSGYTRQLIWWDKQEFRPQRIEFYDRKGDLLKTLEYLRYQEYLGKFWRSDIQQMTNHQTGKSTVIVFESWNFQTGQNASLFKPARLKRLR